MAGSPPPAVRRAPLPLATSRSSTAPRRPTTSSRGPSSSGCRALAAHRPPGPVRRGPILHRGRGRRPAPGRGHRDRAARRGASRTRTASSCRGRRATAAAAAGRRSVGEPPLVADGGPVRPPPRTAAAPRPSRAVKEDHRGVGEPQRGPHLVLLARDAAGWRSLCRLVSRAQPRRDEGRARGSPTSCSRSTTRASSRCPGCRDGELARRLRAGDREGARAPAERYAALFGTGDAASSSGFVLELAHHLLPDDDWLASETARARGRAGAAGRRDQRRPLRAPGGPRAPGRPDRDPPRPLAGRARGPAPAGRRVVPQGRGRAARAAARRPATAAADPVLARRWRGGDRGVGGDRGRLPGRARVRAVPLPGLPGAQGPDAVLPPLGAVLGGRPAALPPADAGRRQRSWPTSSR